MGMFDDKVYLTGDEGAFTPGEPFVLHDAKMAAQPITIQGRVTREAQLEVARAQAQQEVFTVFTSGAAIVNQIDRMSDDDRAQFPLMVVIEQKPSGKGNPMNIIRPWVGSEAQQQQAAGGQSAPAATADDIPF